MMAGQVTVDSGTNLNSRTLDGYAEKDVEIHVHRTRPRVSGMPHVRGQPIHQEDQTMAKYLFRASYTPEGIRGLKKDGGSARKSAVEKLVVGLGGTVECVYFAIGDDDVLAIVDLPNLESAVAASVAVGATGAVNVRTTVLLTPEQMDSATGKQVEYHKPGA
jgi:uncharacterized protein with GYD domain